MLPVQKKICQKQQKPNTLHFALLLVLLVIQEGLITNTLWPVAIQLYAFFPAEGGHTHVLTWPGVCHDEILLQMGKKQLRWPDIEILEQ